VFDVAAQVSTGRGGGTGGRAGHRHPTPDSWRRLLIRCSGDRPSPIFGRTRADISGYGMTQLSRYRRGQYDVLVTASRIAGPGRQETSGTSRLSRGVCRFLGAVVSVVEVSLVVWSAIPLHCDNRDRLEARTETRVRRGLPTVCGSQRADTETTPARPTATPPRPQHH
jgi:hypothetical protein